MENDAARARRFWTDFEMRVGKELGIVPDVLPSLLSRLPRTGLYELFAGLYMDAQSGHGHLTPLFREFMSWIQSEAVKDGEKRGS
jgi:hypothetical protein